jgi:hypothetical protein
MSRLLVSLRDCGTYVSKRTKDLFMMNSATISE